MNELATKKKRVMTAGYDIQVLCPTPMGSNVPATFYVSGNYSLPSWGGGASMRCKASYPGPGGTTVSICMTCLLDKPNNGNWCCQIDFSGNPPSVDGTGIGLDLILFDANGTNQYETGYTLNYLAGAGLQQCNQSGKGTPCQCW